MTSDLQPGSAAPYRRSARSGLVAADLGALLLAAVSTVGLVAQPAPRWSLAGLAAHTLVTIGRQGRRWLLVVVAMTWAGWFLGFGRSLTTTSWSNERTSQWAIALAAITLGTLVASIAHVRWQRSLQERASLARVAEEATVRDWLTELANRRGLDLLGTQVLESVRRRGDAMYCIFLDVDGLAKVNAEVDWAAGDEVLRAVATALTKSTRGTDVVARWGDDEFVVLGPGTGIEPLELERRVRAGCLELAPVPRDVWPARISAGGAVLEPWNEGSIESLLREADREMRLRRTLRRESAAPAYEPVRHDPSPKPPESRR